MAEIVINDVNPSGRGTGYDYVYNGAPVISALQMRQNRDQQMALRKAALQMQQDRLEERARQAALKDYEVDPVSGGYYNDLLSEQYQGLKNWLVEAYRQGKSPVEIKNEIGRYKQQAKFFDTSTKEHDAWLRSLQSDPLINKEYLPQAFQKARIVVSEPEWGKTKSERGVYVPNQKIIQENALSDPRVYNPAMVGSEVVKKLTGTESYTFQGPDARGITLKKDKILDEKGNINMDVAKDIVKSDERYNRIYTTLFNAKMQERQNMGIIGATPTKDIESLVAAETMKEMFPNTLGDFTEKIDKTGWKPTQGKAKDLEVVTTPTVAKSSFVTPSGGITGQTFTTNLIKPKKPQPIAEGIPYYSYDNQSGGGKQLLPSGFSWTDAEPTVVFRATKDIPDKNGKVIIKTGQIFDPMANKGGVISPQYYQPIAGYQVTPQQLQFMAGREGDKYVSPLLSQKKIFIERGNLPTADNELTLFLNKNKMQELDYFDKIREELLGIKKTKTRSILGL